ncbi:MAG: hypothetical protein FD167_3883 [bacterium]|nr:MAG: hypothetical protein FD167_3883 [bacterium]
MKIIFFLALFLAGVALVLLLYIVVSSRAHKLKNHDQNLIGRIAVAETDLDPLGLILVFGEAWQATSIVKIPKGTKVQIIATEGVLLKVKPMLPKFFMGKN